MVAVRKMRLHRLAVILSLALVVLGWIPRFAQVRSDVQSPAADQAAAFSLGAASQAVPGLASVQVSLLITTLRFIPHTFEAPVGSACVIGHMVVLAAAR